VSLFDEKMKMSWYCKKEKKKRGLALSFIIWFIWHSPKKLE